MKKYLPQILFLLTLGLGAYFRIYFLFHQVGNPHEPDFGGDPCQHYSIARNLALGNGPMTDFIFSYWFRHPSIPAMTDIYPPGSHLVMAGFMKILGVNFFSARLASLTLGILSLVLVFFICRRWLNFLPSLAAMLFLALNPAHIEHSTVVMTPVITVFFYLLFIFLVSKKQLRLPEAFFAGAVLGYAQLNQGLAPAIVASLLLVLVCYYRKEPKKSELLKKVGLASLGYGFALLPWAILTWKYFGTPLYSNLSFYPISDDWGTMLYAEAPPALRSFLSHHSLSELLIRYLKWSWKFFSEWQLIAFPLVGYNISSLGKFLFLITIAFGVFCRSLSPAKRISLVAIFLSTALLTILGSSGMGGWLAPRHYLFHTAVSAVLFGLGVSFFLSYSKKATLAVLILVMYFSVNSTLRWVKSSEPNFWKLDSSSLKQMGAWIDKELPQKAKIFYHLTPQDLWCFSHRQTVVEPSLSGGERNRTLKEMKYYKVDYLLLDKSKDIYDRSQLFDLLRLEEYFPGVKLSLIKVVDQKLFLYEIFENK